MTKYTAPVTKGWKPLGFIESSACDVKTVKVISGKPTCGTDTTVKLPKKVGLKKKKKKKQCDTKPNHYLKKLKKQNSKIWSHKNGSV